LDLESQLLAQVHAAPDDDTPRLVYADWLLERGDLRGDFIQKQLRLASMDEADPAYSALYAETERTWLRHAQAWSPPVSAWTGAITRRARRGFLDEVFLRLTDKKPVGPLAELASGGTLRSAHLELYRLMWSEALWSVEGIPLRELHLEQSYAGWREEAPVPGVLSTLTSFRLTTESTLPDALPVLLQGADLRELSLSCGAPSDEQLHNLIAAGLLDKLETLDLSEAAVSSERLAPLVSRLRPRRLGLPAYTPPEWPLEALFLKGPVPPSLLSSPHLTGLRHLGIAAEALADHVQKEGALPFSQLTRLRLHRTRETGALLGVITRCSSLRTLRRLELVGHWPGSELRSVLSSPHLRGLVSLSYRGLDDEDAQALARSPLPHLCRLSLPRSYLGPRGVQALVSSPHLDLVHLELKSRPQLAQLRERFGEALAR
jgi:uncharacterized protein (TIGR02996 family)